MTTTTETSWTARNDVRRGERTADEANGIYERAATRWMHES